MGLFPIVSTAIADIQLPNAAADIKLSPEHKANATRANRASPAPETSRGFVDKEGKLCLKILSDDFLS